MKSVKVAVIFFSLSLLTSCGYRWGEGGSVASYHTISVPFVKGDWDGQLTSAIVRQISERSSLRYKSEGGSLILQASIVDSWDDHIGFRYDRTKKGNFKSRIIPDETRFGELVEVVLVEACSGNALLGPVRICAEVDFDHDYYSSRNGINVFSLGQLTDYDEAHDAAERPLNERLAKKIVDFINVNW